MDSYSQIDNQSSTVKKKLEMTSSTNKVTFGWSGERHQRHDDCAKDPLDRRDGCGCCRWNIHCWLHLFVVDCRDWMWNLQVVLVVDGWSLLLFWLKQVDLRWCVKHEVNSFTSSSRKAQVLVTLWWTDMLLFWSRFSRLYRRRVAILHPPGVGSERWLAERLLH